MTIPSLRGVPDSFDTERLTIRCPRAGEGPLLHEAVVASLDALREFPASLPWAMAEPTLDTAEQFCREGRAHFMMRSMMPMLAGTPVRAPSRSTTWIHSAPCSAKRSAWASGSSL